MNSLTISNVKKRFGKVEVLKGVSLEIQPGEFVVLVGPSGCGKSTLLNLIAGLETLTTGVISIQNRNVNDVSPKDRDIAMVFQSYALYPNMSVKQNLLFGLEIRKVPKEERKKILQEVATMLQIEEFMDRRPAQLSGGQRQRVAIGRALSRKPTVFLFDEPLSNLDAKLRTEMRTEIKLLHQRLGITVVYVTHDQIEAMTLADKIAVMNQGLIQQYASPFDVYNYPANLFVAGFIGSPAMNFIECTLKSDNGSYYVELTNERGQRFKMVAGALSADYRKYANKKVILGLRPEYFSVKSENSPEFDDRNTIECWVKCLEPTGPDIVTFVDIAGTRTICKLPSDLGKKINDPLKLQVNMSKALFFDPISTARIG